MNGFPYLLWHGVNEVLIAMAIIIIICYPKHAVSRQLECDLAKRLSTFDHAPALRLKNKFQKW
jgi:hypothetical protein